VYREKHLSFDIFCQKAEEKKTPFRERTVSGAAARQEEIFETPHNFPQQFISPSHLPRLVSTCK
jgi:hypothetical protein